MEKQSTESSSGILEFARFALRVYMQLQIVLSIFLAIIASVFAGKIFGNIGGLLGLIIGVIAVIIVNGLVATFIRICDNTEEIKKMLHTKIPASPPHNVEFCICENCKTEIFVQNVAQNLKNKK